MEEVKARLAEMHGDIKHGLALHGERIERLTGDVNQLRQQTQDNATRLTLLEAINLRREGQEKGIMGSAKVLWAVVCLFAGIVGAWLKSKLG